MPREILTHYTVPMSMPADVVDALRVQAAKSRSTLAHVFNCYYTGKSGCTQPLPPAKIIAKRKGNFGKGTSVSVQKEIDAAIRQTARERKIPVSDAIRLSVGLEPLSS